MKRSICCCPWLRHCGKITRVLEKLVGRCPRPAMPHACAGLGVGEVFLLKRVQTASGTEQDAMGQARPRPCAQLAWGTHAALLRSQAPVPHPTHSWACTHVHTYTGTQPPHGRSHHTPRGTQRHVHTQRQAHRFTHVHPHRCTGAHAHRSRCTRLCTDAWFLIALPCIPNHAPEWGGSQGAHANPAAEPEAWDPVPEEGCPPLPSLDGEHRPKAPAVSTSVRAGGERELKTKNQHLPPGPATRPRDSQYRQTCCCGQLGLGSTSRWDSLGGE